jgi:hypothetical protein
VKAATRLRLHSTKTPLNILLITFIYCLWCLAPVVVPNIQKDSELLIGSDYTAVFGVQVPGACCESRLQALREGHYECFKVLPSNCSEDPRFHFAFQPMCARMWRSKYRFDFSSPLSADWPDVAQSFALYCIKRCDVTNLKYTIDAVIEAHRPRCRAVPRMNLRHLVYEAARLGSLDCLHVLFKDMRYSGILDG